MWRAHELGGPVVVIIVALSVVALGVILDRLWTYQRAGLGRNLRLAAVLEALKSGQTADATTALAALCSPFVGVIVAPPLDGLLVLADGSLLLRGQPVGVAQAVAQAAQQDGTIRLMPDHALPAGMLIGLGRDLKAAGAQRVIIVAKQRGP